MSERRRRAAMVLAAGLLGLVVSACSRGNQPSSTAAADTGTAASSTPRLRTIALPDLTAMAPSVQSQLREAHERASGLGPAGKTDEDAAAAFGEVGRLLLAAQCFDDAEPYFANARLLAPTDGRWPYYLGQVARLRGDLDAAVSYLEEARLRRPGDVATLVWLGEIHLAAGRPEAAEGPLRAALAADARSAPALYRLGRAALARRDFTSAARHLEAALEIVPDARAVHHPLAMAYRALGDAERAARHAGATAGPESLAPPDPLMQELNELLDSAKAREGRGVRALERGDWQAATEQFRLGLALDQSNVSLHQRLGTALIMMNDTAGAADAFERALAIDPTHPQSQFSLGVMLETSGRLAEAAERYAAALRHDPSYVEARLRLAALLRRQGRIADARSEYERVLALAPGLPDALFGDAMSLAALGRYAESRARLDAGFSASHGRVDFAHALVRVLSAAPDAGVRDGRRALAMAEAMNEEQRRLDGGEAMAMALAEVGRFDEAVTWQRSAVAAAERARQTALAGRMTRTLGSYEQRRPNREPWRPGEWP